MLSQVIKNGLRRRLNVYKDKLNDIKIWGSRLNRKWYEFSREDLKRVEVENSQKETMDWSLRSVSSEFLTKMRGTKQRFERKRSEESFMHLP